MKYYRPASPSRPGPRAWHWRSSRLLSYRRLSHLPRRFWRPHAWSARTSSRPRLPPYRATHRSRRRRPPPRPALPAERRSISSAAPTFPPTGGPCSTHSELNELIEQALAHNADLKAAQAALLVAHENALAQRGAYAAAGQRRREHHARRRTRRRRSRRCPATTAFLYTLITPQLSVSYTPDVFGLNKRTVESLRRAGAGEPLSDDRGRHHAQRQCRRGGHPEGLARRPDRRRPTS